MDTVSFFLIGHSRLHSAEVAGGTPYADRVFAGLSDDQMRARPGQGLNSLVWLLWHMARTEDVAVNVVVAGRPQLLDENWLRQLNVPWRTIGTGMTGDEVSDLTTHADVAAVRAYRSAVGLRTREMVTALRPEAWDEILGIADTAPANAAGAFARGWVDGVGYRAWQGHSRAAQLASSAIAHNAMHLGEAITIRSQAGFGLGI
jgi:DinB superfamily